MINNHNLSQVPVLPDSFPRVVVPHPDAVEVSEVKWGCKSEVRSFSSSENLKVKFTLLSINKFLFSFALKIESKFALKI